MKKPKYNSFAEWKKSYPEAYKDAHTQGMLEMISNLCGWKYIKRSNKPEGYWTFDLCNTEALKYKNRSEFSKKSAGAYQVAYKNNWLDEICSHMEVKKKSNNYWTFELCNKEAIKYTREREFSKKSSGAYQAAKKNGWLFEICVHMETQKDIKPHGYWIKERCKEEALKYNSKKEWSSKSVSSYNSAVKGKWIKECCEHMNYIDRKPVQFWTKDKCKEEALKFNTSRQWSKISGGSYCFAKKHQWLDECTKHMKKSGDKQ